MTEEQPQTEKPILEQVREERVQLEKQLTELRQLKAQITELESRRILGGESNAGQQAPVKPVVTPKDYAKMVERGIMPE